REVEVSELVWPGNFRPGGSAVVTVVISEGGDKLRPCVDARAYLSADWAEVIRFVEPLNGLLGASAFDPGRVRCVAYRRKLDTPPQYYLRHCRSRTALLSGCSLFHIWTLLPGWRRRRP